MAISLNGVAYNLDKPIVGKVISAISSVNTTNPLDLPNLRTIKVSEDGLSTSCIIGNANISTATNNKYVFIYNGISEFICGDIVLIEPTGRVNFLFKINSLHNSILFTENCNHNCIMCSQPPIKDENFVSLYNMNNKVIELMPKNCSSLGITGGEPTLHWNSFINFLKNLNCKMPETSIHILTNGSAFSNINKVFELSELDLKNIIFGIPLYSDYYEVHNQIVYSSNAFNQTIQGLHNLARFNVRTELRFVITKVNYSRMEKFARFIYKNLPFVEHIAFMGLEPIGNAKINFKDVWIDPDIYIVELEKAVRYLNSLDMNVSIYNLPLCIIPNSLKKNYRKSISDWKNVYLEQCDSCKIIEDCGGFFSSANDIQHKYIIPQ